MHPCIYSRAYIGTKIQLCSFQLAPRRCKIGRETFEKIKSNHSNLLQSLHYSLNLLLGCESGTNFLWWHLGGWNPPGSDNFTSFEVCCGFPTPQMNTWWNCTLSCLMTAYLHLTRLQHWFCPWQESGVLSTRRHTVCAIMPELILRLCFFLCLTRLRPCLPHPY